MTAGAIWASFADLSGNGTIVAGGGVLDTDLSFDNRHGLAESFTFGNGGQLRLNVSGTAVLGVGYRGAGTMRIAEGVTVSSSCGRLGYQKGSVGTAVVTGEGSTWNNSNELRIGYNGAGALLVEAGGKVASSTGSIGWWIGASSTATIRGVGSLWTNDTLYVGYGGRGSLVIDDGGRVSSSNCGYVGYRTNGTGTARVSGPGSMWTSDGLSVGEGGTGELVIERGGEVSDSIGYLGLTAGCTGSAKVSGEGSMWTNSTRLQLGSQGVGRLYVADGGKVVAKELAVSTTRSVVSLHVSGNDMILLGTVTSTGTLTNKGLIQFYADAFLAADSYTPFSESAGRAMTWSGTGTYNAYGGAWSSTAHTFTVTAPTALAGGAVDAISSFERMLFTVAGGERAGASFGTVTGSNTFSASLMTAGELNALTAVPGFDGAVLAGWDFATNLPSGQQVMLSFDVGLGYEDVEVWHLSGGTWTPYSPDLLTYDSHGVVSFTVTSFSGYAVTAVPEPVTLFLLALGGLAMLKRRGIRG